MPKQHTLNVMALIPLISLLGTSCADPQLFLARKSPYTHYYFPKDYVGSVDIYYNIPGAPALEQASENYRIAKVPKSGILETSSPAYYEAELVYCGRRSGTQYYYYNEQEEKVRRLSRRGCENAEVHGGSTGYNGDKEGEFFFVGTEAESRLYGGRRGCYGGQRQPNGAVVFPEIPDTPAFYLPDQYVGWVNIRYGYDSQNYPELPVVPETGHRLHQIPSSGILQTSSPQTYTKQYRRCHKKEQFFYERDSPLEDIKLSENNKIWGFKLLSGNGKRSTIFFVGTEAEFQKYGQYERFNQIRFGDRQTF